MDTSGSKSKRGVRRFLREKADQLFKQTAPPGPLRASTAQSPSPDPMPASQTSPVPPGSQLSPPTSTVEVTRCPSPVPGACVTPGNAPPTIIESPPVTGPLNPTNPPNPVIPVNPPVHITARIPTGVWGGLEASLRGLHKSAQFFPSIQSAIGTFLDCLDLMEVVSKSRQEYEELASELETVVGLLAEHMKSPTSARMSGSIANFARGIEEQAKIIESKRERTTGRRLLDASADEDELAKCCKRITSLFRQLQLDANLSVWSAVNEQTANTRLERLAPVKLANYDSKLSTGISRRTCTDGTRTAILAGLDDWSHDEGAADIYWMNGMAGTGKTTIAFSFSEALESREQLAASFFCTRNVPECREVGKIIPTIAYQFAQYSLPFQSALCEVLSKDLNICAKNIATQFDRLLLEPLLKVKEAIPSRLVVTIDALDECDNMSDVELLLSILLKHATKIPLKFFVTSRPEPEIYDRMMTRAQGPRTVMHLHEVEKSLVQADIELYLTAELESMSPTPTEIEELTRRSGALFIYAATLVRYIGPHKARIDSQRRLRSMLSMSLVSTKQYSAIDSLYAAILQAALEDEDLESQEIANIRCVLDTVVCVQEPVSIQQLAMLTELNDPGQTLAALQPLRAVLYVSETSGLVATLHASFPDFMFDEPRSGSLHCNLASRSGLIVRACFGMMKSQLKFNICKLDSSFVPDVEVKNLDDRARGEISEALGYACRHWGSHLANSSYSDLLCVSLNEFLSNQLLFWMEVLNLKREIAAGAGVILKAKQWLQAGAVSPSTARLAEDARKFVASFAANPVSRSTPHIYISSLPFCPTSSLIYKQYRGMMKGLIDVNGSAMQKREFGAVASWKIGSRLFAVAYSPDGTCIAVGCSNGTILILNAHDGTRLHQLNRHTSSITSVAYSPNGAYIVSGSRDKTVLIWNARCGTLLPGSLEGHASFVNSVAYSPDGTCIISGSNDTTIRMWNPFSNTHITLDTRPFNTDEPPSAVHSVAYSPDGTRVVSGSKDGTICLWNTESGTLVTLRHEAHTSTVSSVAYSPDGRCIASGSNDKTIRLWNAHDITPVVGPLEGHSSQVSSIAYSPNGAHIVSGSGDKTVRVWSTCDGSLIGSPLIGHTGSVWSVAYSPDGTRIISGSHDGSVRVWNAPDGMLVSDPLNQPSSLPPPSLNEDVSKRSNIDQQGIMEPRDLGDESHIVNAAVNHYKSSKPVSPLAYSPDGSRIASGSGSCIRVWDAYSGTLIATVNTQSTGFIRAIAFSPNGTRIASVSDDNIQLWNTQDGVRVWDAPQAYSVLSLAYSPDGTRIVSCSTSKNIKLWDAQYGSCVNSGFKGCTSTARAIAYSPDGTRFVTGSDDATICVWNSGNGTPILGPLRGHAGSVLSVSYSPNGLHIVSGSSDKTIRVWSACDGTPIAGPFNRHTGRVTSVGYSPDGTRIISGSDDTTVCVSDASDGTSVAGPFEGHTGGIVSVAFSPDGTRILSGCKDHTIRVWSVDARTNASTVCKRGLPPNSDGWVTSANGELLLWVPSELVSAFITPSPGCLFAIANRDESLRIEFSGMLCGEGWDQCYTQG